jgi:UDP-N-acetylglucosamine diphosphorylase / glucose-1-phosphate thymidylyltransferase / UDP-N-acetylgalactosamine diphosphorylase / glucosamine-1-phosphate N-acetyltransferase / galactosamine-1-phosphate N-acetyltransferase
VTALYLLEPASGPAWAPFDGVRPVAELRAGVWRVRERWQAALGCDAAGILSDRLADFSELDEPPVRPAEGIEGPAIIVRSDFAPGAGRIELAGARRLASEGITVGWTLAAGERWRGPHADGQALDVDGLMLRGSYDLVTALEVLLAGDCAAFTGRPHDAVPEGSIVLGDPVGVVSLGAAVEPGVVFDVRQGAVVLERDAEVRHGTRLEGPCYVGAGTRVLGGFIRTSVFGPRCSVRGEISNSSFVGYANKSHDGFVGHSVVGHWVNLGAGTTTSNLKNTYGPVRLEAGDARVETGRTFLGSLVGDHAKTAIGTMLATGTVIGAGANVFGSTAPKYVPPFAWGADARERLTLEGFLRTAERVLPRRDVALTDRRRAALAGVYRRSAAGADGR